MRAVMYIMERITRYVCGEFTEEEADELWIELLKRPEEIKVLETYIYLKQLFENRSE